MPKKRKFFFRFETQLDP